jgi:hypothetical protein
VLNLDVRVVAIGIFKGLKTRKNRVFLLGRLLMLQIVNSFRPKETRHTFCQFGASSVTQIKN